MADSKTQAVAAYAAGYYESMELAQRLRALRERAGLRQDDLADRLNRHQTWVSKVERGSRNVLPQDAMDWAEACGFTGEIVFLPASEHTDRVLDLFTASEPRDLAAVADLLHALPRMTPERRGMLLAMLRTALDFEAPS